MLCDCLDLEVEHVLLLLQGRSGADGARGMPGQTGPKVCRLFHSRCT